jgi:hypothetical protein
MYPVESTEGAQTKKRRDTLWGTNAGLKYEVKDWLFMSTGYLFKQRNSIFHNYSYNDHQITVRGSVVF